MSMATATPSSSSVRKATAPADATPMSSRKKALPKVDLSLSVDKLTNFKGNRKHIYPTVFQD
jgi:hypothetical protein